MWRPCRKWSASLVLAGLLLATGGLSAEPASPGQPTPEELLMRGAWLAPPFTCDALSDPQIYASGAMASMGQLVAGKPYWFFRSDVDFQQHFPLSQAAQVAFAELVTRLSQRGMRLVVMLQPTRGLMHADQMEQPWRGRYSRHLARQSYLYKAQVLRSLGALVADMEPVLMAKHPRDYFFRRDHHWTPYGAEVSARQVADVMLSEPGVQALPEVVYETRPGILLRKMGTMNVAVGSVCGNSYGYQWVRGSQTVPRDDADNADALFGDVAAPRIALVGTSNSDNREDAHKNYNFQGFLQEHLSRDVANYSMTGGGAMGALQGFFYDPAFLDGQFHYLIWELPVNYDLEEPEVWREVLSAVSGGCKEQVTLARGAQTIPVSRRDQRVEVLANAGSQRRKTAGRDHLVLDMTFSESSFKDFYVLAYYDDGQREKVRIRRPARLDTGRFTLRLDPPSTRANLLSVLLEFEQPVEAAMTVDASLCEY